ncbi:MAG: hypothetical protein QOD06_1159 [Candidatus Binatota bacterium]|jgi:hypothetical protein|nr:hypothetical protein [Candidatus Binatota bacterium]
MVNSSSRTVSHDDRRQPPPRAPIPDDARLSCDVTFAGAERVSLKDLQAADLGHGGIRLMVPARVPLQENGRVTIRLKSNHDTIELSGLVRHVDRGFFRHRVGIKFEMNEKYQASSSKLTQWVYDYSLKELLAAK